MMKPLPFLWFDLDEKLCLFLNKQTLIATEEQQRNQWKNLCLNFNDWYRYGEAVFASRRTRSCVSYISRIKTCGTTPSDLMWQKNTQIESSEEDWKTDWRLTLWKSLPPNKGSSLIPLRLISAGKQQMSRVVERLLKGPKVMLTEPQRFPRVVVRGD